MDYDTKRFPRTLNEAFGPYTSRTIFTEDLNENYAPMVYAATAGACIALVILTILALF
jgi:hypothetical protein